MTSIYDSNNQSNLELHLQLTDKLLDEIKLFPSSSQVLLRDKAKLNTKMLERN